MTFDKLTLYEKSKDVVVYAKRSFDSIPLKQFISIYNICELYAISNNFLYDFGWFLLLKE